VIPKIANRMFQVPHLTRTRIIAALAVAVSADGLQFLLNGVGWVGPDQVIDVMAMLLTCWLLGFHWLLLPTFALEIIPLADELPTWTACVAAVIVLRKRQQRPPPPLPPEKPVIEI
jgi:hypothetical protein